MLAQKFSQPVAVLDARRTPVGRHHKSLKNIPAYQLAAVVIRDMLSRHQVISDDIGQTILGNVVSAGCGQNIARQALRDAELPMTIPAYTVNHVCGSSLQSLLFGANAVLLGQSSVVLAGGAESASQSPFLVKEKKECVSEKDLLAASFYDGLFCHMTGQSMGELVDQMADKHKISREDQDRFALESHRKVCLAQEQGFFDEEIIPVPVASGEIIRRDDKPRGNITLERLAGLPSAFSEKGTLTAGNSSSVADSAGLAILTSRGYILKNNLSPEAWITGFASVAVEPRDTFESGAQAVKMCLKACGLKTDDIDLFEICESFAAQSLFVKNALNIPEEKFNVYGGDTALGHPLGAAGIRILSTVISALRQRQKKRGLVCVSFGGGGSIAIMVEKK